MKKFYLLIKIIVRNIENLIKFYEKIRDLRQEIESLNQDYQNGRISQETYELKVDGTITELNKLFSKSVSESLDAIHPHWEAKVLGIKEEYLSRESDSVSANSEPSGAELAQAFSEHIADGDFHFAVAMDYIAESMTESQLDSFLTEIRNSEAASLAEIPNNEVTSEIIHRIVEQVSGKITMEDLANILEQIETHNLNPADIIEVIDSRIENGEPISGNDAHEHQDTAYNCGPTLAKVILAQHGKYISEGELTLRALLDGTFDLNTGCFKILFGLFSGCVTPIGGGTLPIQMGYILQQSGISVDYNYNASLDNVKAALAAGKSVIICLNVAPIWNGQPGAHVLQVLQIDEVSGEVIANDTGRSDGAAIRYPLDRFLEGCKTYTGDGILMITTKEAPPSSVGEVIPEKTSVSTLEVPYETPFVANGEPVAISEKASAVINGYHFEDEINSSETERAEDLRTSPNNGNTVETSVDPGNPKSDKGNIDSNNKDSTSVDPGSPEADDRTTDESSAEKTPQTARENPSDNIPSGSNNTEVIPSEDLGDIDGNDGGAEVSGF